MHPGHPLPAVAQLPAGAHAERRQQALQEATVRRQHQTGAHVHHADTELAGLRRDLLPGQAQLAGEILTRRRAVLAQRALAGVAIPANRRAADQHRRSLAALLQPLH
ncbi:hypothetical protein D9M71_381040 [compost metagenome]